MISDDIYLLYILLLIGVGVGVVVCWIILKRDKFRSKWKLVLHNHDSKPMVKGGGYRIGT